MEKELSCSNYGLMMEMSTEQLTNGYFHTNWDNQNDQNDPFESTLSSMVSSPTTTTTPPSNGGGGGGDGIMIRELIGRLGSICDSSGEVTGYNSCSTNTSCYSTPLNSPPPSKFNLSSLMIMANNNHNHNLNHNYPTNLGSINADPGFVERAAKFSCFGNAAAANLNSNIINNHNFSGNNNNINNNNNVGRSSAPNNKLESGKLSRVNSEKKMVNNDGGDSREGSSVSEQNPGVEFPIKLQNDANSRKRKSIPKAKLLKDSSLIKDDKVEVENEESDAKRGKVENGEKNKKENAEELMNSSRKEKDTNNINDSSNNNGSNKDAQKPEPLKDYIHVRARRGQATDSHSLAERVRREKISERMKFLQDLVPGCNKVTGKATVLDEIINYVQSLQRQVEFLSMKLSTVNPRMEFNMEALLSNSKDMFQSRGSSLSQTMYPLDQNSAQAFPFAYQSTQQMQLPMPNGGPNGTESPFSVNPMNAAGLRRNPGIPLPIDGLADSMTQLPTFWEDDLQSLVQMGIVPNQTQSVPGTLPNAQMKVEL